MRHLLQALIHGLGWMQNAKDNNAVHHHRLLKSLTHLAINRGLEEDFGGGGGDMMMPGMDPQSAKMLEQCDIDVNDMMGKVMMSGAMGGGGMGGGGLDPNASMNLNDLIAVLAEDGEESCNDEQTKQYTEASDNLGECLGLDQVEINTDEAWAQRIADTCQEASDAATSIAMGLQPEDQNAMNECLDDLFGDNPLGDILRELYHAPDKVCSCLTDFGEQLPMCIVKVEIPSEQIPDEMKEQLPFELGDLEFPLSLMKKGTCLFGQACGLIDDMCVGELQSLDRCLPHDESFSCLSVIEKCALEAEPPMSITAPQQLTAGELPDACVRVYSKSPTTNVPERLKRFDQRCNSQVAGGEEEDEQVEVVYNKEEEGSSSSDEEETNHEEEELLHEAANSEVTQQQNSSGSSSWMPMVYAVGVVAVAFVTLVVVRKLRAAPHEPFYRSRNNFAPVADEEFDHSLKFEQELA